MSTTQFKLGSIVRLKLIMKMKHVELCSQCRHQKFPTPPLCVWWSLLILPVASGTSFRCFSFIPQSKDILCCRIICIYKSISSVRDGLVPCPWCPPPFTPSTPGIHCSLSTTLCYRKWMVWLIVFLICIVKLISAVHSYISGEFQTAVGVVKTQMSSLIIF